MSNPIDPEAHRQCIEAIYQGHVEKARAAVNEYLDSVTSGGNWPESFSILEAAAMVWGHSLYDELIAVEARVVREPSAFEQISRDHVVRIRNTAIGEFSRFSPQPTILVKQIRQYLTNTLAEIPEIYWEQNEDNYSLVNGQADHGPAPVSAPVAPTPIIIWADDRHRVLAALMETLIKQKPEGKSVEDFLEENFRSKYPGFGRSALWKYRKKVGKTRRAIELAIIAQAKAAGLQIPPEVQGEVGEVGAK